MYFFYLIFFIYSFVVIYLFFIFYLCMLLQTTEDGPITRESTGVDGDFGIHPVFGL